MEAVGSNLGWDSLAAELRRLRSAGLGTSGRTTTLEVLGLVNLERHHQAMIAWLLDPSETHRLGDRLLTSMLSRAARSDMPAQALAEAEVLLEVEQPAGTRADIVVRTRVCTLVIELKVHATEGVRQTERLAEGYAHEVAPVYVFLTLHVTLPLSDRFHPMSLGQFADDLAAALDGAPQEVDAHGATARAVALDYLTTLRRMTWMTALDDDAARLWLAHGMALKEAEAASRRVLERLTVGLRGSLEQLAQKLGPGVVVREDTYEHQSTRYPGRQSYLEGAVALAREHWLAADGGLRAGVGFGYRLRKAGQPEPAIDAFNSQLRPFVGLFAPEQALYAALGPVPGKTWANRWVLWQYAEISPPPGDGDLVEGLLDGILGQLCALWEQNSGRIDAVIRA
jgi:hypothetical protein